MSKFSKYMKQNKVKKENTTYVATKSLVDENGEALLWTLKAVSTKEVEAIRESCTRDIQVTGKPHVFRQKVDNSKFATKLLCASVVEPNLYDKELQDSYGVMTPEELILELIDDPKEFAELLQFTQEYFGHNKTLDEQVEEAKN